MPLHMPIRPIGERGGKIKPKEVKVGINTSVVRTPYKAPSRIYTRLTPVSQPVRRDTVHPDYD
jgi:hypothetical protein